MQVSGVATSADNRISRIPFLVAQPPVLRGHGNGHAVERTLAGSPSEDAATTAGADVKPKERDDSHPPRAPNPHEALVAETAPAIEQVNPGAAARLRLEHGSEPRLRVREVSVRRMRKHLIRWELHLVFHEWCGRIQTWPDSLVSEFFDGSRKVV